MTAANAIADQCPHCRAELYAPLSDGRRLCLQCRTEYAPGEQVTPEPSPELPTTGIVEFYDAADWGHNLDLRFPDQSAWRFALAVMDSPKPSPYAPDLPTVWSLVRTHEGKENGPAWEWDVTCEPGTVWHVSGWYVDTETETYWSAQWDSPPVEPSEPADLATAVEAARELYVGSEVFDFDLEQRGTCVDISDDGTATIEIGTGFFVYRGPDEFELVADEYVPTAVVEQIALVDLAVIAQVLRAGAEVMVPEGEGYKLGIPPEGWLPFDADALPVIEHGASYAIAWIADRYGITRDDITNAAQAFEEAAEAAREATQQ